MRAFATLFFLVISLTCFGQKQKHVVHSPAYHTTHRPPLEDEPTGFPKNRKENRTDDEVWICSSKKSRTYHNDRNCVELNFCRAGVMRIKQTEASEKEERRPCSKCYSD